MLKNTGFEKSRFVYSDNYLFAVKKIDFITYNDEVQLNLERADKDFNNTNISKIALFIFTAFFLISGLVSLFLTIKDFQEILFTKPALATWNYLLPLFIVLFFSVIALGIGLLGLWGFYHAHTYPITTDEKMNMLIKKGRIKEGKIISIDLLDDINIIFYQFIVSKNKLVKGEYYIFPEQKEAKNLEINDDVYIIHYGNNIHILL